MPRLTQSKIHSDFSTGSATWSEYRAQVIAFYDNHPHSELNDHITREFNKKITNLSQAESLYISPYNAGLRYIGDGVFTVDPLSFNPYFYIDAASSMLGVLESPSLDLNPAVSSTLDIITATRAGTATYTDASGNIQTASPNTVRVDHVDGVPMILVEPAATNLVVNSEDFNGVGWNYSADALETESNSILSPMGIQTADKISKTTTRSYAYAFRNQTVTSGQAYTWSVFMKKGTHDLGLLSLEQGDTPYKAFYDLTDGTSGMITGSATTSIEDVGNGWFRCSLRGISSTSDVSVRFVFGMSYSTTHENWPSASQGDGLYVYIWGAQLEEGTIATSYIPTSGSAVTRAADELVIDGSDFTNFFNNSEGTIYCEFEYDFEPAYEYIYNIQQDGNNEIRNQFATSSNVRTRYVVAGVSEGQTSVSGAIQGSLNRSAYSYKTNNFRSSVNGSTEVEDLTGTASVSPIKLQIGGREGVISNIKFKRLIYWPHHSDNI
tara:strand:+ start:3987 stop:5465 length:1479 start_codon:yes stop_codon:yes gene_type:complete